MINYFFIISIVLIGIAFFGGFLFLFEAPTSEPTEDELSKAEDSLIFVSGSSDVNGSGKSVPIGEDVLL